MKNKHKVVLTLALSAALMCGAEAKSCRLTFSGYEGTETLKDFPALVKIPDGLTGFDYRDSAADGSDLAFFGADGRPLACEIDTWNPEGDSYVWVRVPELTKATSITARWGKSGGRETTSVQQRNGGARTTSVQQQDVWNDDYMGVWHFSKFRKGVTHDSKNGLEAEVRGKDTRLFIHADAFVGKGYYAAAKTTKWGTYLNVPNDPRWTAYEKTGKLTVSFMVNSTIDPDTQTEEHHARIVSNKAGFGDDKGFEVAIAGGERIWSCGRGVSNFWYDVNKHGGTDKYTFRDGWAHVTVTYDAEVGESAIYFNGRRVASAKGAAYAPTVTGRPLAIGHFAEALVYERVANEEYFCGYLDEMRLSKAAFSPDRIRADYLTLTRPTQFAVAEGGKAARVLMRRLAEGDTPPVVPAIGSWRGVNAVSMFYSPWNKTDDCAYGRYLESEFALFKKLGLNFARLPIDYRFFISAYDWEHWLEEGLEKVDAAVEYGRKYGIHVNLCLYRAPGKIAYPAEKGTNAVTRDPVALEAFKRIWREFARRYKGIPNSELSFNLVNEPSFSEKDFIHVFGETVDAIHKVDPGRFIILDGNRTATVPVPYFFNVPLTGQSFRGYAPGAFSHYGVWYGGHPKVKPRWPAGPEDKAMQWVVDGQAKMLAKQDCIPKGYPVMIGEFGCYAKMDHESCLKWMEAGFKEWRKRGYGWAIWDYDGPFGFVDSGRPDAEYIEIDGRKVDRKMLELLRQK